MKTFKEEVDEYFTSYYGQLKKTITLIAKKYKSDITYDNVISHTYIYIIDNEVKLKAFSEMHNKTMAHTIYSFVLRYVNGTYQWSRSYLNKENRKFSNKFSNIDDVLEPPSTHQYDDIYNEEFIADFHLSLTKLDRICFNLYYYEGMDNPKDLAEHLQISLSSTYTIINKLKDKLKKHIQKNKIH